MKPYLNENFEMCCVILNIFIKSLKVGCCLQERLYQFIVLVANVSFHRQWPLIKKSLSSDVHDMLEI